MNRLQPISTAFLFDHVIGTGGIGGGIFFMLEGNETLGRNDSRMGKLLPYNDYCKQHIILHYISVLLGAGNNIEVFPIGKIGNDKTGRELITMMKDVGMDTSNVTVAENNSTMFSVCFQYPDHSGGNITTAGSACDEVSPADIDIFFNRFSERRTKGIIMAAPEVPLQTRLALLRRGKKDNYLNVASLLSGEADTFRDQGGIALTDVLAINIDEAKAIAQTPEHETNHDVIANECVKKIQEQNPSITLLITAGAHGVYVSHNKLPIEFIHALKVPVVSTAGAGDAFIGGFIAGVCCGLPVTRPESAAPSQLNTAADLGLLVASMSVLSPDTINKEITADTIQHFIVDRHLDIGESFAKLFKQNTAV